MSYTLVNVLSGVPPEQGVRALAIRKTIETSPLLTFFQFESVPGLTSTFFIDGELPDPDFRAYNTTAPDSTGINEETAKTELRPMASRIPLDPVLARVNQRLGIPFKTKEINRHLRASALNWKRFLIGRVNTPIAPKGLYGWIDQNNSALSPVIVDAAAAGSTVIALTAITFIQKMGELEDATLGAPDLYFTNRNILRQIDALMLTDAANTPFATLFKWETVEVAPNIRMRMGMWRGIPMIPVDDDSQRNPIMAFDELSPNGATSDNSSIVAVRVGEDDTMMLQESQASPDIRQYFQGGQDITEIDWPLALEVRNPRSAARLRGLKAV